MEKRPFAKQPNFKDGHAVYRILLIVVAVLINFALPKLAGVIKLPLYLDNIGTLLAAILGCYLPGIFVGYLNNIINMFSDPASAYYVVLSTIIACFGTYFGKKGYFDNILKVLVTVPVFAFIGGVLGSLLTYLIYGYGLGEGISAPYAKALLENGKLSVFRAQMLSDVIIDIVDKAVTAVSVYFILKLIPKDKRSRFKLTGWRQTPLPGKTVKELKKSETRSFTLRSKMVAIISMIMLIVAVVTTVISYFIYRNFALEQYTYNCKCASKLAASYIDPDKIGDFLKEGDSSPEYVKTEKKLEEIRNNDPDIEYIYVYIFEQKGVTVLFDIDSYDRENGELEVKGREPGEVIVLEKYLQPYKEMFLAGEPVESIMDDTIYGRLLTTFEPVYDSEGRCVCYAGADIKVENIRVAAIGYITKIFSLFTGFYVLILALCIWLIDYHIVYPIGAMTMVARKFAYDTEEGRDKSVEKLQELEIRTGDEIENLYESLSKTIAETVGYLDEVTEKSELINKMQNGLICVLADMVESRDKNTGNHVRSTAAYVRLIMNKMKEKGIYGDVLTDEYIDTVINYAPLHDIGKIMISDLILNKPAKLTDEEFELMKAHTVEGGKIIESAMRLVSDGTYLEEAKNVATYHHERWDGKGYPCGMKGEEIPLAARIMAVADVFDALVSKRSYKEPFPYEKALEIIRENSGKQFDPVIAEIFLECEPEIREIMAALNKL